MADRLAALATQIEGVRQLDSVVSAMRGIAASRAQSGRRLLPGVDAYARVVSRAIGAALNLLPPDRGPFGPIESARRGLVVFCAEQGFVGAFSERVLGHVADEPADTTLLLIGTRGGALARDRGMIPAWAAPMASNAPAVADLASRLADALYDRIAKDHLAAVDVVYPRTADGSGIGIERRALLPLDYGQFQRPIGRRRPLTNVSPAVLIERLASEYIFAQLCRAAMQAFEAENEARMLAMGSAHINIQRKLDDLAHLERRLRQEEITAEVLELATGAEAAAGAREVR